MAHANSNLPHSSETHNKTWHFLNVGWFTSWSRGYASFTAVTTVWRALAQLWSSWGDGRIYDENINTCQGMVSENLDFITIHTSIILLRFIDWPEETLRGAIIVRLFCRNFKFNPTKLWHQIGYHLIPGTCSRNASKFKVLILAQAQILFKVWGNSFIH